MPTVTCTNGHAIYTLEHPLGWDSHVHAALFKPIPPQLALRDQQPPPPCHVCGDAMWFAALIENPALTK